MPLTVADIRAAATRIAGRVVRTPSIENPAVSRECGAEVWLKLDNLQPTGAFKERGAANRLALLSQREREGGVIAMSAGNHAQAVARTPRWPASRPRSYAALHPPANKVTRTEGSGARVVAAGRNPVRGRGHAHAAAPAPTASPSSTPMTTSA
jgi:threonine dehydratase